MNFNPIHWLRLVKPLPVKIRTYIDGHYIYKLKNHFVVFTSKPVEGIECTKISDTNIKTEGKDQYMAHFVHRYDPTIHKLTQPNECYSYYNEHKTEIDNIAKKIFKDYNE